jgi:hypothetical protein
MIFFYKPGGAPMEELNCEDPGNSDKADCVVDCNLKKWETNEKCQKLVPTPDCSLAKN